MAIIDNTLLFSDHQAITGDERSDNIIDLHATGTPIGSDTALTYDPGKGCRVEILCQVTEDFDNLTSLAVEVHVDNDEAFGSATVVAKSGEIPLASLVAGHRFSFPAQIPEGAGERYLSLYYNVTGSAPSAGKIFASIVAARQTND